MKTKLTLPFIFTCISTTLWIIFSLNKTMITEMWIANAFQWIGLITMYKPITPFLTPRINSKTLS
jgi:hypothetical protein